MFSKCAERTSESAVEVPTMPAFYRMPPSDSWWTSSATAEDLDKLCSSRPLAGSACCASTIEYKDERFTLRKPIRVQESFDGGMWTYRYLPFGITAYGSSKEEAWSAFRMEFACCWHDIASEEDSNLTEDARELKTAMLNLIEHVEPIA